MVWQGLVCATHPGLVHPRLDGTHVGGSSLSSSYLTLQVDAVDPALACKVVRGEEEEPPREAVEAHISGTTGIGPSVEFVFAAAPQRSDPEKGSSRCFAGTANPEKAVSFSHDGIPTAPE